MKDIMLKITGKTVRQDEGSERNEDIMEFVTEARMYERNGAVYLLYDETELSGIPGCRTRLRLRGDELQMKRFGENAGVGNEIKFEKGKRYNGLFDTPFGPIELEVLTNDLSGELTEAGKGQIDIDYSISLKGLHEGRNILNITLM